MAGYAYKAVEVSTGQLLAELPLTKGQFSRLINQPGSWSADLPIGDPKVQVLDPFNNTDKNSVEIVVERNHSVIYCGLITDRSYDSRSQTYTLSGKESWAYYDRRIIEWDLTYSAIDQGLILQDILTRAAASPFGNFRLDLPSSATLTTGVPRTISYLMKDAKPISSAIEDLANESSGFEFSVDGYWSGGVLRHRLNFGYPELGARSTGALKWELPGQIVYYTWAEAGSAQVNEVFGIGDDGSGGIQIQRIKTLPGRQLLLQAGKSFRTTSDQGTLTAQATKSLTELSAGVIAAKVRVLGSRWPQVGDYSLGDDATFVFNDPAFQGAEQFARILGWTLATPSAGQDEVVDLLLTSPVELQQQLDDLAKRLRTLETHSLGIPAASTFAAATGGNPAPPQTQTIVYVDLAIGAGDYTVSTDLALGSFTTTKAGTFILEGSVDAEMLAWDNYVSAPRRECNPQVDGQLVMTPAEWPFGITRTTHSWRSSATALASGTYTARLKLALAGANEMKVFSGYLRVTWTG